MLKTIAEKICYTPGAYTRFNKKTGKDYAPAEVEQLVTEILLDPTTSITNQGKNYYVTNNNQDLRLTINAHNFRLITADIASTVDSLPKKAAPAKKAAWYERREGTEMAHLVYLNAEAQELAKLIDGSKTMVIRGAAGRKSPLGGRAQVGDRLYFVETGGDLTVAYSGVIKQVIESEKMSDAESHDFINTYQPSLQLTPKQMERWAGKKYLAVYEVAELTPIEPFKYRREKNMDDWIITTDINLLKSHEAVESR